MQRSFELFRVLESSYIRVSWCLLYIIIQAVNRVPNITGELGIRRGSDVFMETLQLVYIVCALLLVDSYLVVNSAHSRGKLSWCLIDILGIGHCSFIVLFALP